jgi:hypothetical protein
MDFEKYVKNKKTELDSIMETFDINEIKSKGVSLRIGNKVIQLAVDKEETLSLEDEILKELGEKIKEKNDIIKKQVNDKVNEIAKYTLTVQKEFNKKEKELERRIKNAKLMPEINFEHAKRGLSIVSGNRSNRLFWLVNGIYWPKYIDGKKIEPKYSKKLITDVVFLIETEGNSVLSVSTRKPIGLDYFLHYHQSRPDCWGNWKPKRTWETPDDILNIGREAEAVLENINTKSLAITNPRGLPRKATILRYIVKEKDDNSKAKLGRELIRKGLTTEYNENEVWGN